MNGYFKLNGYFKMNGYLKTNGYLKWMERKEYLKYIKEGKIMGYKLLFTGFNGSYEGVMGLVIADCTENGDIC